MSTLSIPAPWAASEFDHDPRAHEHEQAHRWRARHDPLITDAVRSCVKVLKRYHPITFEGADNLPSGPALLVGNHGLLGYEALFFFEEVLRRTGRMPVGLADRWFFRVPLLRDVLVRVGGTYGHRRNALSHLAAGDLVVVYPGGAREAFKTSERDLYRLRWEQSHGFVRLAIECGVPVVPFAAAGVDDTFDIVGRHEGLGQRWMGHDKYDVPRLKGVGGLPLPRAVPFLFRVGLALELGRDRSERAVREAHERVTSEAQRLLDDTVAAWRGAVP